MINNILKDRPTKLFVIFTAFFVANALIAECIGTKIFSLEKLFGQGMWIIAGSLTAFLVSQIVDVTVFHKIKKYTGEKKIWLRATGSTVISQLVDSFIVLFIAFKIGRGWTWQLVLGICVMNYIYKFCMAVLLTPVIYFIEKQIENYVGHETAHKMKLAAMGKQEE